MRHDGWRVVYDPAIAVDHYEGDRGRLDPRLVGRPDVAADFVHNQTYAAVRYLPRRKAAMHLLFVVLIGTTAAPGLALTARNVLRGEAPGAACAGCGPGCGGRLAGAAHRAARAR